MSLSIYSIIPRSYIKKSHKSPADNKEIENLISELRGKIVDCWNYKFEVDDTIGSIYKLKFDQFEKKFLKKSDFVFILVNSQSEEAFKSCIEKLIKSCKNSDKLANIVVLSLNTKSFDVLKNTVIEFVYCGNEESTENLSHWNTLEDILKRNNSIHSSEENPIKTSLPLPIANSGRKSPSKFKTFFNSLPSRFESDKKTLHRTNKEVEENTTNSHQDVRLPNINVLEIGAEKREEINRTVGLRAKVDSSKLSLNSLFKRRSKKARDSGLSLNSSVSTGSGSRKSEIIINRESVSTEGKETTISSMDHSPVILTAKIEKNERHKAKIEIFKTKASKVIRSSSCLHSPKSKRSKYNVKNVMNNVVSFSSTLMTASSDIGNQSENINRKGLTYLMNSRGKSEPPTDLLNDSYIDNISNGMIKYYSWNDVNNECKNQLSYGHEEISVNINQPECNSYLTKSTNKTSKTSLNELIDNCKSEGESLLNTYINNDTCSEDEVFHTTFKPIDKTDILDENQNFLDNSFTESSYSTFLPSSNTLALKETIDVKSVRNSQTSFELKIEKHTKMFKDDPMESLDKLIKSIQISCEEMRATRKSFESNKNDVEKSPDIDSINSEDCHSNVMLDNETLEDCNECILRENSLKTSNEINRESKTIDEEQLPLLKFPTTQVFSYREASVELIVAANSISNSYISPMDLFQQTCQRMIRNPIIVSGIFAATTYTAPIWCSYIPRNICLTKLFCGTLDYLYSSEMVQSIPNQIILTGRNTASVASKTIKRILF